MANEVTSWQNHDVNECAQNDHQNGDAEEEGSVELLVVRVQRLGQDAVYRDENARRRFARHHRLCVSAIEGVRFFGLDSGKFRVC